MQNEAAVRGGSEPHKWQHLPSSVLERIFSFLNHRDRASASVVCKSWEEAYTSPSFWKSVSLSFSKGSRTRPRFSSQRIVLRFGQYIRHLTILCRKERLRRHNIAHNRMTNFFYLMVQADVQLNSIRMPRLMVLSEINEGEPIALNEEVTHFLNMQTSLTDVDFTNGDTHTVPGLMILESLVAEKVQHLRLQKFFHIPVEIFSRRHSQRYMSAISRFHGLRSLWLNYRYLSDDVMFNLFTHLDGQLEVFGILVEKCTAISKIVSGSSWTGLKSKFKKMEVHFQIEFFTEHPSKVLNSKFLPRQLPLAVVECQLKETLYTKVNHYVFNFFKGFAATLRHASFDMAGYHRLASYAGFKFTYSIDIRNGASDLVRHCPLLESLTIKIRSKTFQVEELFATMLDTLQQMNRRKTSLKLFRVIFQGLKLDWKRMSSILHSTYVPKYRQVGVKLVIKLKKGTL